MQYVDLAATWVAAHVSVPLLRLVMAESEDVWLVSYALCLLALTAFVCISCLRADAGAHRGILTAFLLVLLAVDVYVALALVVQVCCASWAPGARAVLWDFKWVLGAMACTIILLYIMIRQLLRPKG